MKIKTLAMLLLSLTAACRNKNDAPLASLIAPGDSDAFDSDAFDRASAVSVEFTASDGVTEDVAWTTSIDDLDGFRFVRFRVSLRANLFTGARARLTRLEIPVLD